MNEIQKNLYEMLVELDDICRKNNIIYYLAGGTALGAVRNEGFLPWDDDIDLYITRDNWLKLEKVLKKNIPENRSIITMKNTEYYYNPIPRYVNCNTTLIYRSQMLCGKAAGQHIELLIMDPMPTDEEEIVKYKKHLLVYTELVTPYFVVNRGVVNPDSFFDYKLYKHYYKMSKKIGLEPTLKILEDILFSYSEKDCEVFCMRWGLRLLMYDKKMFGTPRLQKFEDKEFYVAEKAEEIFRIAYGDTWMYVPEVEEQVTHNSFMDIETPFEEYVKKYMKFIKKKPILNAYKKNKERLMKTLHKREMCVKSRLELKRMFLEEEFSIIWNENVEKIKEAAEKRRTGFLEVVYGSIDRFLFSPSAKKYNELTKIDEEKLYPYFVFLLARGLYSKIISLDARYKLYGKELKNPEILRIVKAANSFRIVSQNIYDYKNYKAARKELSEIENDFKKGSFYRRLRYSIELELYKNKPDKVEKIKKALQKLLEKSFDAEICKLLGDCYFYSGQLEEANIAYENVKGNTRNGILLLDVYKKTGNRDLMMVE